MAKNKGRKSDAKATAPKSKESEAVRGSDSKKKNSKKSNNKKAEHDSGKKEKKEPLKLTMEALEQMTDSSESADLPPEEEWDSQAKNLKKAIMSGAFDCLLNKEKGDDSDDESIPEIELGDDDDDSSESETAEKEDEKEDEKEKTENQKKSKTKETKTEKAEKAKTSMKSKKESGSSDDDDEAAEHDSEDCDASSGDAKEEHNKAAKSEKGKVSKNVKIAGKEKSGDDSNESEDASDDEKDEEDANDEEKDENSKEINNEDNEMDEDSDSDTDNDDNDENEDKEGAQEDFHPNRGKLKNRARREAENDTTTTALKTVTDELAVAKKGWPWAETFDIVATEPLPFGKQAEENAVDIHDDLKREVVFYESALEAVNEARSRCNDAGISFSRPEDFFAEMVKTDDHMAKVKDRLIFESKKIQAVAQRKSNKEQQLRSKEAQSNKVAEKAKKRKEHQKAVADWAESVANNRGKRTFDDGDDEKMLQALNKNKGPMMSKKRMAADRKYGYGGKRGRFKQNANNDDFTGFNPRGNFEGGMKNGGNHRPGKRARDAKRTRK